MQVEVSLFSPEAPLLGLRITALLLPAHRVFPLGTHALGVSQGVLLPSFDKDRNQIELGPTAKATFQFNHLFKVPVSTYNRILRYRTLENQHMHFRRHNSAPNSVL